MNIHESAEDYLEAILMLKQRVGSVRSIDIANELGYTKASISIAMKKFRENEYIEVDEDGYITLTKKGHAIATKVYERHRILSQFFISLGVSKENATNDACKIEHDLSEETFNAIKKKVVRKIAKKEEHKKEGSKKEGSNKETLKTK